MKKSEECKKCKRTLPKNYNHKLCENCTNKKLKNLKNSVTLIGSVVIFVGGTALKIATKGVINIKK